MEARRGSARMSLDDPAIITGAISGAIANREQCPAIPYTPAEYAAEARRIVDQGAVHIHIHARKPDGTPSYEVEDFMAIRDSIRAEVADAAIINFSTGAVGVPVAKRIAYLEACRPAVAALNMGSMNYAKYSRSRKDFVFKFVFANPFEEIIELLEAMRRLRIKPEHECFDLGHVGSLEPLVDMGLLQAPLHADFVMGVVGGVRRRPANLAAMADNMPGGRGRPSLGRDRDRPRPVDAGGGGAHARRLDPGWAGGQLLSSGRLDGAIQRRADRQGAADDRGRGSAAGDRPGSSRTAGDQAPGAGMTLPLEGIKVLDLTRLLPGGFCSLVLADFGADVIKVEDTGMGDYVRWSPPYYDGARRERPGRAVPGAQSRQAINAPGSQDGRGQAGAAGARTRGRCPPGVVPAGRARPSRRRIRAPARAEPTPGVLRDHRLRPGWTRTAIARATTSTTSA